jgi:hypothetical protein
LFIALIVSQTVWGKGGKPGAATAANGAMTVQKQAGYIF